MNPAVLLILSAGVSLFFLEKLFPLRAPKRDLMKRLLINASISLMTMGVAFLLIQPVTRMLVAWTAGNHFGIISVLGLRGAGAAFVGFLLLDLSFYYWHVANHKTSFLWRFHNVHHLDPDLDVSTGFRFHPGEVAISTGFRALQVLITGVTPATLLMYEAVFQLATLFHHSNLRLPLGFERALNLIFVTPRMHGIHHSNFRQETDSNYSVIFSFWDRLHRSLTLGVPQREIVIGIPAYSDKKDNSLKQILIFPFKKQRDYWKDGSGHKRIFRTKAMALKTQWIVE